MDQISYQNGFICGMATKGLVRSGQLYQPIIYNDAGVYDYFYIDFRRALEPFSLGMWNESIVIHDSVQLSVSQVIEVSFGVYKVYCDFRNKIHGITVLNKKTGRLRFASTGERVPVFSTHMFIEGQDKYIDGGYIYDKCNYYLEIASNSTENQTVLMCGSVAMSAPYDQVQIALPLVTAADSTSIILK